MTYTGGPYPQYQQHYQQPQAMSYFHPPVLKHSPVGISSFIVTVIAGLCEIIMLIMAIVMAAHAQSQGRQLGDHSPEAIAVGLLAILGLALALVGLILGIIGCFQRDRKRLLALLGAVGSGVILFLTLLLIVIGLIVK